MSEMTNEELRLKIAAAQGWKIEPSHIVEPDGKRTARFVRDWTPGGNGASVDGLLMILPNWPESIADAWTLVEEWSKSNAKVWRRAVVTANSIDNTTVCQFFEENSLLMGFGEADTAPRAISLAYLASTKDSTHEH